MEHRILPLIKAIRHLVRALPPPTLRACGAGESAGRYAARDVIAPRPVPPEACASEDGYLTPEGALPGIFRVQDVATPARPLAAVPGAGACVRVDRGAVVPGGTTLTPLAQAVLVGTDAVRLESTGGGRVAPAGAYLAEGALIAARGKRIGVARAALMAHAGIDRIQVVEQAPVNVAAIGDEFASRGTQPAGALLMARTFDALGVRAALLAPIPDDPDAIGARAAEAVTGGLLILAGGTGPGVADRTVWGLRAAGARIAAEGLNLHPGRTTALAVWRGGACLCVPGGPDAACAVTAALLVPVLARWLGVSVDSWENLPAWPLSEPWDGDPDLCHVLPAAVHGGEVRLTSAGGAGGLLGARCWAFMASGAARRREAVPFALEVRMP